MDGLSEAQIGAILEEIMPEFRCVRACVCVCMCVYVCVCGLIGITLAFRGNDSMISLLFHLVDVDQGGTVNVIEYLT